MTSVNHPVYIVTTGYRNGLWNMAFDMSLMDLFRKGIFQEQFGRQSMLWRFYAWDPPALSIGHGQRRTDIDETACSMKGIDIVRRPTGGRAVLHIDEFTYACLAETAAANTHFSAMIHGIIRHALLGFGVKAEFKRTQPDMRKRYSTAESASCFTASARNELHVEGRKLVGSAQRRSDRVILQHGSLLLSGRHKLIATLLECKDPAVPGRIQEDLEKKTVSVQEVTGVIPDFNSLCSAMIESIKTRLKKRVIILTEQELTSLFTCKSALSGRL